MLDETLRKLYEQGGHSLPTRDSHGTDEEIRNNLTPLKPTSWRLEGNQLIGDTPWGPLVQSIPPNYILTGTSEDGLPTFKKIA